MSFPAEKPPKIFFARFLHIHNITDASVLMSNAFPSPILLDPCRASPLAAQQPCNRPLY